MTTKRNVIFQYMITSKATDTRGDIKGRNRSSLYQECAGISRESFEIYADKIGVEHIYSDERVHTKGHECSTSLLHECLRIIYDPMFDEYDDLLFADTDIVVNTEDNIFELCNTGADVYGVLESDFVTHSGGGYNAWDNKNSDAWRDIQLKWKANDCPIVPTSPPNRPSKVTMMNTGFMVWTKEARLRARELFGSWEEWCYGEPIVHMCATNDQPYISANLMKHGFKIGTIDTTWNDSPHYATEDEFLAKARMCHYTGGEWKIDMLQHFYDERYMIFN